MITYTSSPAVMAVRFLLPQVCRFIGDQFFCVMEMSFWTETATMTNGSVGCIEKGGSKTMVINLNAVHWGPKFKVPTILIKKYCGHVLFRENLDDELLEKELKTMRISGSPVGYSNAWFIRKKGTQTWIKVGESVNRYQDFGVRLDTTELSNGSYQVLGFMSVRVEKEDKKETVVSRQTIADFEIRN
jgi:hypothetical protein